MLDARPCLLHGLHQGEVMVGELRPVDHGGVGQLDVPLHSRNPARRSTVSVQTHRARQIEAQNAAGADTESGRWQRMAARWRHQSMRHLCLIELPQTSKNGRKNGRKRCACALGEGGGCTLSSRVMSTVSTPAEPTASHLSVESGGRVLNFARPSLCMFLLRGGGWGGEYCGTKDMINPV